MDSSRMQKKSKRRAAEKVRNQIKIARVTLREKISARRTMEEATERERARAGREICD